MKNLLRWWRRPRRFEIRFHRRYWLIDGVYVQLFRATWFPWVVSYRCDLGWRPYSLDFMPRYIVERVERKILEGAYG
jgi:hypothetical protein